MRSLRVIMRSMVEQEVEPTKLVCFDLQGQEYAADIQCINESLPRRPIAKVPLTPSWLLGIINLRGDVVAVLDLSLYLGLGPTVTHASTRVIVAQHEHRRVGFLCDNLRDLRVLDTESMQAPPATLSNQAAATLSGVVPLPDGSALQILNIPALFESKQLAAFRRGATS